MSSPYAYHKLAALGQCALGLLLMAAGLALGRGPAALPGVFMAVFGGMSVVRGFVRFIRILAAEQILGSATRVPGRSRARSAELPKQIFLLLQAVAEADGSAGVAERQLVARFLLERFPDPVLVRELEEWKPRRLEGAELLTLVRGLRMQLTFPECETIFHWCALVTLIDERFRKEEHAILQSVANGLGIPPEHARRIFHHAKARVMAGQARGGARGGPPPAARRIDQRAEALQILGLETSASQDQIRARHRELVKKYHPDAHAHLGPVAAEEATERFREIQEAYEALSA